MKLFRLMVAVSLAVLIPVLNAWTAQIEPASLAYQGTLTDNTGQPIVGAKTVYISLYDTPTGGTPFWTETYNLMLKNGQFSVVLGSDTNPLGGKLASFNGTTYLGVRVDPDPEMPLRQKLTSVAYSLHAAHAFQADNATNAANAALAAVATAVVPTNTASIIPAGTIVAFGGMNPPPGWKLCNGESLLTADFPELFTAIGYTYGGAGTSFSLPSATGRTLIQSGTYTDPVSGTVTRALGQALGAERHTLAIAEIPSHTHTQAYGGPAPWGVISGSGGFSPSQTGSTGGGGSHNNMQPSLAVNFIIKY